MKAVRLAALVALEIRRDRRGFAVSTAGVALGIAAFVFLVGLGEGVGAVVRRIFPVDAALLEVVPPRIALGEFLGGGRLDAPALRRLAELPGVRHAYPKLRLSVPAVSRYDGDFFGRRLRMGVELLIEGVPASFLARDVGARFSDPGPGAPVYPAVVSRRLLELYNHGFAPSRGLPTLGEEMIRGFRFPVTLGASFVGRAAGTQRTVLLEIVGVSERAPLAGVLVPIEAVERWNALFGAEPGAYSAVILEAADAAAVPAVAAAVRRMGFEVDETERKLALRIGGAVRLVTAALTALSGVILLLAAVNISRGAYAQVAARRHELGLYRAVGARRGDVAAVVLSGAALAGLTGTGVGVALALGGALGANFLARAVLPPFPFQPESFFLWPPWLFAAALAGGVGSAVLGAVGPALAAARVDPVRVLRAAP
ncbi:MAG: ABC transporter permease [Deltaproteobacteria bacterium]|nr:MAG: ABC transporter permease [Deltaproteobacteria bacterium]